ncbi:hypothetical protein PHYSODRAFT_286694 [Phytophthora sojae]|uniref:Phosphatidate cytidylyltransferase n=1 Tax=Phytophthora sojae (strain P6497) TaxID=1094619 RepID=G4ZRB8_PHYSP|nr:hypothetical protein PHYSODRAFT_286694 [Phytophthora sojae]EGZ13803.1 hypothetical protein PHYSODRAFT_286694 [Phytophthora sojae]|eukprot:XP_009531232.1 hypothetical protein PHYSODRAFT_286694 [Phytophthora sojae]
MPQPSSAVQNSPLESSYHSFSQSPTRRCSALAFLRHNAVQRTLSAAVLAPAVIVFLWQSPAIATSTVCSFMTSTCSYEYACLANRIRLRLLTRLEALESSVGSLTGPVPGISDISQQDTRSDSSSDSFTSSRTFDFDVTTSRTFVFDSTTNSQLHRRLSLDGDRYTARTTTTRAFHEEQEARELAQVNSELTEQAPRLRRCAVTDAATYIFGGHEWLAALCISSLLCVISSCAFLLTIQGVSALESTEFYESRWFYTVATGFVAAMCACLSPDWQYAVIVFLQNAIFTILTLHSTACPMNQLTCNMSWKPSQIVLAGMVVFLLFRFATCRSNAEAFLTFTLDAVGLVYIIGTLSVLVAFVDDERRTLYRKLLIALLYVVWASDTGAYITGKALALAKYPYYNPLAAHLSKNKDYEGTLGAIGFGIVAMVVSSDMLDLPGSFGMKVAFTVVAVVIGRLGDLFESLLKRAAGVKDSGSLIPGHGGVLDRIDALMFATLVFSRYYAMVY